MSSAPAAADPSGARGLLEHHLGQRLVSDGVIQRDDLARAWARQAETGVPLTTSLVDLQLVDGSQIRKLCSQILMTPSVSPADVARAPEDVRALLPVEFMAEHRVLPFARRDDTLLVATSEPWRLPVLAEAGSRASCRVSPRFVEEAALLRLLREFGIEPTTPAPPSETEAEAEPASAPAIEKPSDDDPELMSVSSFEKIYQRAGEPSARGIAPPEQSGPRVPEWDRGPRQRELPPMPGAEPKPEPPPAPDGRGHAGPEVLLTETVSERLAREAALARIRPLAELDQAKASLIAAGDTRQVGWILARCGLAHGRRVALFRRRGALWIGWTAAGEGVAPESVRDLQMAPAVGTIFDVVESTGRTYAGPLGPHKSHEQLLAALGGVRPRSIALVPVHRGGRPVLGIYLDSGAEGEVDADLSDLELLAQYVPGVLDRLARVHAA